MEASAFPLLQTIAQQQAEVLRDALAYVKHAGASAELRGEPHPQKWLVDRMEAALRVDLAGPFEEVSMYAQMRERKNQAYTERNQVVAALARLALAMGYQVGVSMTTIEGWDDHWHGCVLIDLRAGQVSWHFHDAHAEFFKGLPPYVGVWDGHDTPEKYRRLASFRLDRKAQERQENDADSFHRVMSLLRATKMEHGTCEPRSRRACTRCNAQDQLDQMLANYRGAPVVACTS